MRVLVTGADGYIGWPLTLRLKEAGHEVLGIDNWLKRGMAPWPLIPRPTWEDRQTVGDVPLETCDMTDDEELRDVFRRFEPEAVVHLGEIPSGPYSMANYGTAEHTMANNLGGTLNLVFTMLEITPDAHLIKLGTLGEYGTPDIPIPEGWITVHSQDSPGCHHVGSMRRLFPREAGSWYHTCKILETDMLLFWSRMRGLRVTDLMQGPVYGIVTDETLALDDPSMLPTFHYDAVHGTVLNRFVTQAMAGHPLTVYGDGHQIRGYIDLRDSLQCIELALDSAPEDGSDGPPFRVLNQFTETFSVLELARMVADAFRSLSGMPASIRHVDNPRIEEAEHFYRPSNAGFLDLGLSPRLLDLSTLVEMFHVLGPWVGGVREDEILPTIQW